MQRDSPESEQGGDNCVGLSLGRSSDINDGEGREPDNLTGRSQRVVGVGSKAEELMQGPERRPSGRGSHQAPMSVLEMYCERG